MVAFHFHSHRRRRFCSFFLFIGNECESERPLKYKKPEFSIFFHHISARKKDYLILFAAAAVGCCVSISVRRDLSGNRKINKNLLISAQTN